MDLKGHREVAWYETSPTTEDIRKKLDSLLIVLLGVDQGLAVHVLGTAFVVGTNGNRALCFCAAHSLKDGVGFAEERQMRSAWRLPPDLQGFGVNVIKEHRIYAVVRRNGQPVACQVEEFAFANDNDIGLVTIAAPDGIHLFDCRLPISFEIPELGSEL